MTKMLEIKNLTFSYDNHSIFEDFNLELEKGKCLSLVGVNGSGKTTLLKILSGKLLSEGQIKINDVLMTPDNFLGLSTSFGFVFDLNNYDFICETVEQELALILENLAYHVTDMKTMINEVAQEFELATLLKKDPNDLTTFEKQKVLFACALIHKPQILVVDSSMSTLNKSEKNYLLNKIKNKQEKESLSILLLTRDLEEALISDKLIVIDKAKKIIEGPTLEVMKKDRLFSRLGIRLPFMVDLSLKLKFYDLLEEIILDKDRMVKELWK